MTYSAAISGCEKAANWAAMLVLLDEMRGPQATAMESVGPSARRWPVDLLGCKKCGTHTHTLENTRVHTRSDMQPWLETLKRGGGRFGPSTSSKAGGGAAPQRGDLQRLRCRLRPLAG